MNEERISVSKKEMVDAFNAWMQDFIAHPEEYTREFQSVQQYLRDKNEGREPSYGENCVELLQRYWANGTFRREAKAA